MRLGQQTKTDMNKLKKRVRSKGHKDLKEALFISAKVKPVAAHNTKAINELPGKLYVSKATHIQVMSKSFKPTIEKISGRIGDTQYVDELYLKVNARVMLIFNVDVSDLLNNGATGTVIGLEEAPNGNIRAVVVKFDNPEAGKESRERNPMMVSKYPNGTVIMKREQDYSLTKTKGLVSSTAKLIQIPLVLVWSVTVHKFQGQTVRYPQKVVIDLKSVFEAAQTYVMASRVQELDQLYILEELPRRKIYPSQAAIQEIERLLRVSINKNPTPWKEDDDSKIRLSFLNCRSIRNKFENVKADKCQSQVIILTETWLEKESSEGNHLPKYNDNFINIGRGKGIATYFKNAFKHMVNVNCKGFSIVKLEAKDVVVIGIYRSHEGNCSDLIDRIFGLVPEDK